MRTYFKLAFFIILIAFFLPQLVSIKHISDNLWYKVICIFLILLYSIYESKQLIKDDKINNTNTFRNRLILIFIVLVIYFLSNVYMNSIYKI